MSNFFTSMNDGAERTWNGMKTNASSLNPAVDLFYTIGSARGKFDTIKNSIAGAFGKDKDTAVRLILWARDVREGAGERQTFRDAINFMAENQFVTIDEAVRIMKKIPELGRWDDLSIFVGTILEKQALDMWVAAIKEGDGLAAKWAPRKGELAVKLRKTAGLTPKAYRKLVVENTSVVETAMCNKEWEGINFSHVPSMASSRYQKAFNRNGGAAYAKYKEELAKPEAERDPKVKINANAIYPYNIVQSIRNGDANVAAAQWKALPDYMEGSEYAGIFPVVDTSGSMGCPAGGYGSKSTVTCMDVAISLGLYVSERNKGIFKDEFISFSSRPKLHKLSGDLKTRVRQMNTGEVASTNLLAVFKLMLDAAKKHNIPEEDMPKTLLILSDMQFNSAVTNGDETALENMNLMYRAAGYERPHVVFWNINSQGNGVPSTADKFGTALVSGFSPAIMKSILNAKEFTPESIMNTTLMKSRYDW